MTFRALFFGSPAFAVPSLEALHAIADVVGVVCQPDKPAGRGLDVRAPAVKVRATELGLVTVQPSRLKTDEFAQWMRAQTADVAVVVAYGRILPRDVLDAPRLGCVNVHASLLPKYRGAAPITWALVRGEHETGVTLMKLDEGLDTGPTFARVAISIDPHETAGELTRRLADVGAHAIVDALPRYLAGHAQLAPQDDREATLAPILAKEDGRIEWERPSPQLHDHVRGMNPWPGAFTTARGHTIKILRTRVAEGEATSAAPGQIVMADKSRVLVACGGGGLLDLLVVQPEGRRAMTGPEWSMGRGVRDGDRLG